MCFLFDKLKSEDYCNPEDFEQEKQENSNVVYQHDIYIGALEVMADNLTKQGIVIK